MSKPIGILLDRTTLTTIGLGALFVLCWSSGFIGAKLGARDAAVPTVLMWRFLPLVLVLALVGVLRRVRVPRGGDLGRHVVVGVLSQSGYLLTVYAAIGMGVSTGTVALIDGIQPLVVAALVGPLLGAVVTARQWAGLVLGLGGVVTVTWADALAPTTDAPGWAYLVPFTGMLCLVGATFVERRARERPSPLAVLMIHCATSAVVFTALALATGTAVPPLSGSFWVATAWLVVFSTLGGYGLYWHLLGRVVVTQVNTLMFLVPPVTTVWGATLFSEPFTWLTVAGLALALVATVTVARSGDRGRRGSSHDGSVRTVVDASQASASRAKP